MSLASRKSVACASWRAAFAFVALLSFAAVSQAQQPGPFANLIGSWSGSGSVAMSNGSTERIRCRATYGVGNGGAKLQLQMLCASDSYKIELQSSLVYQGGEVRGTWTEKTRGAGGEVSGSVNGNHFDVMISAQAFSATLSLTTQGNRQSVIIQSPGSAMSQAVITLNRAS
jgi:hypothetical protein